MKKRYLGLDAHKSTIHIGLAFAERQQAELYGKASTDVDSVVAVLRRIQKKYGRTKEEIALCYEAGPTGVVLARRLRILGYDCEMVAPSLIRRRGSDRVKTDRRDAKKLARLFRAGELGLPCLLR